MAISSKRITINLLLIAAVASIPIVEKFVPLGLHISDPMTDVFVYAILGPSEVNTWNTFKGTILCIYM